jgi:hypothetical protein
VSSQKVIALVVEFSKIQVDKFSSREGHDVKEGRKERFLWAGGRRTVARSAAKLHL